MDTAVIGDWKKTSVLARHDDYVASNSMGWYSRKLLPTLDCRLLARVS
jgi:hypothetical protein